jgi:dTDP-4-dehydrorhamnose 3,5-epimerase
MPMPVKFEATEIDGVLLVETGLFRDERGYFSESYSRDVWAAAGFNETFVQDNVSLSRKGTLRGLHYQVEPAAIGKLVRCLRGAIFDVAVDLRKGSPSFGSWIGRELNDENHLALWIPGGFAHGFLALSEDALVHYKCSNHHSPEHERALAWNDPQVGIAWPCAPAVISEKDAAAPMLEAAEYNFTYRP